MQKFLSFNLNLLYFETVFNLGSSCMSFHTSNDPIKKYDFF